MYAYITKSKMLKLARKSNVIPQRTLIEVAHQTHEDQRIVSGWMGPNFQLVWLHWCEGLDKEQWYYPTVNSIRYIVKWIPEEALVDRDISIFHMLQTVLQPSYLPSEVTKDIGGRLPRGHTYAMHNVGPFVEHLTGAQNSAEKLLCVEEIMVLLMHALRIAVILARHGIVMTQRAVFCVRGSGVHIIPVLVQFSGIVYHHQNNNNNNDPFLRKNLLNVMDTSLWNFRYVPEDGGLANRMEVARLEHLWRLTTNTRTYERFEACVRSMQEAMKHALAVYSRSRDKRSYEEAMNRLTAASSFSSS